MQKRKSFLTDPIHPVQLSVAIDTADKSIEELYRKAKVYPVEHIIGNTEAILNRVGLQAYMSGRDYAASFSDMEKLGWMPDDWSWQDDVKQIIAHMNIKPTQYMMNKIHNALMTGEGPPVEELAKEVGYEHGKAIARTSVMNIYVKAALRKWDEDGVLHCKRIEMEDSKTCPICRAINGKEYLIKDLIAMPNPQSHDTHENCLLGETPILAPGARKSYVGLYKGPAIEIVFEGGRVITTPNHMFLTPIGFSSSACLRKGDDIFYYLGFEGPVPSVNPDNHWEPAMIKDVVSSFSENSGMVSRCVPSSTKDLHGDGAFMDGEINISSPNSLLWGYGEPPIPEKICELFFGWTNATKVDLSSDSDLASMLFAMANATDGGMGIRRQSEPFVLRKPLHSKDICLASASNMNSGCTKPLMHQSSRNPKSFANCLFGLTSNIGSNYSCGFSHADAVHSLLGLGNASYRYPSTNKFPLDNFIADIEVPRDGVNGLSRGISIYDDASFGRPKSILYVPRLCGCHRGSPGYNDGSFDGRSRYTKRLGDVRDRFSSIVSTRKVLEVNIMSPTHDGLHMYDLETSSSLYIANGLVSSNCRGSMVPVIDISTYSPKIRPLPDLKIHTKNNKAENVPVELYSMLKSIMHGSKLPFDVKFDNLMEPDYKLDGKTLLVNPKSLVDEDIRDIIYSEEAELMWPSVKDRVIKEYLPLIEHGFAKQSRSWESPRELFVNNWIAYRLKQSPMDKDFWSQAFFASLSRG